jgi:hypothetical protein
MPEFLKRISPFNRKDTANVNRYEGFTGDGRVVLRDRRGTAKAEIPEVSLKGEALTMIRSRSTSPPREACRRCQQWATSPGGLMPR